ncbi:nucleoside triphosphate pyrophosphohydrolase family protein [Psychrobacter glacincola]|uniref:nucleoside triphosphate pyrophosphohydrolase family protein n=1 Tax=Psychrobacter glacincola TaxID=56810 RepID=UPI0039AFED5B
MSNLPLQPLVWFETEYSVGLIPNIGAQGAGIFYRIAEVGDKAAVTWHDQSEGSTGAKELGSICEAKSWIETDHYPSKMQPYVKPDSITDIRNWFKAAKPEPTDLDKCVQIGCHFEEFAENLEAINGDASDIHDAANDLKGAGRSETSDDIAMFVEQINGLELLDALCDQIVTATGVAYMMGFDIEGALKEVIRSNNSKMVNGKFEFDANGKIAKPDSYSEPDLTLFVKESDCE